MKNFEKFPTNNELPEYSWPFALLWLMSNCIGEKHGKSKMTFNCLTVEPSSAIKLAFRWELIGKIFLLVLEKKKYGEGTTESPI